MAIVGAGPVGLSATIAAQLYSPTMLVVIDVDANRLNAAVSFGATHSLNNSDGNAVQKVMELTKGKGVDVVLECIGTPIGWDISEQVSKLNLSQMPPLPYLSLSFRLSQQAVTLRSVVCMANR